MRYFIIDKKDGKFSINMDLARKIFQTLNHTEQEEISVWLSKNEKAKLNEVISILYGTISQRRRMNARLVKAIKEYKKEHKNCHLVPVKIEDNVKYLTVVYMDNGAETLNTYTDENGSFCDSIEKWIKQQTVFDEVENEYEETKKEELEQFNKKINKTKFKIKIKRLYNKFRRWVYSLTHKNVRDFNKTKNIKRRK